MPSDNNPDDLLKKLEQQETWTHEEIQALIKLLTNNPKAVEQLGKYNVNITKAEGNIYIGDRLYLEWNLEAIEALIEVVRKSHNSAKTIPQNIPRSGAVKFVGREEVLEELHQQLEENKRIAITAITGMGGLGKTELALQYAQRQWEKGTYPGGVCWLGARQTDLGTQIVSFARTLLNLTIPEDLNLLESVQYCWQNWREGKVLIVLDDVVEYEAIKPYLPPTDSRFLLLLTTRQKLGVSIQPFNLEVLSPTAALELLQAIVGEERIERELEQAEALCQWLGYLPLGLELAGRYLERKPDLDLEEMGKRLALEHDSLQHSSKYYSEMTAPRGVMAAFDLSWQDLNEKQQELCLLLSLFAVAPIPWQRVEQCLLELESQPVSFLEKWFPTFLKLFKRGKSEKLSQTHWEDIRDEVVNCSLVKRQGKDLYQLHQLIREFLLGKLEQLERADEYKRSFCQVMVAVAKKIPERPTRQEIEAVSLTVPHLAEVATTFIYWLEDEDLIWPFFGLSNFYEGQGAYQQAKPWLEQCLSLSRKRLGQSHPGVATSLNNLALLYRSQGRYSEAEPLYLEALEILKRLLGQSHPGVATSLNNLAVLYQFQGRYSEAESFYLEALEMRKSLLEQSHPDVAQSLNNLAEFNRSQGRYQKAEALYLEALEIFKRLLGQSHPDVAISLHNLAKLYRCQERYQEAEPLYLEALEIFKHLLGQSHPHVATSLNDIAILYQSQGRYSEAEPLFLEALEMFQQLLGKSHPSVADILNNLAELYRSQGRYSEAEPLFLEALEMSKSLLGQSHPDVATSLNNLAGLYKFQGRYSEAEPLFLEALEMRKGLLGQSHPDVASSLNNLAELYRSQGRYSEAEPFYLEALEMRKSLLGQSHPDVANSLNNLAGLYQSQGRYSEAKPLYQQALDIAERKLGTNHPNTLLVRRNLESLEQ